MKTLQLDTRYLIVNSGWKSEVFIDNLCFKLCNERGQCHAIGEPHDDGSQLVGFGGERWRGRLYFRDGKAVALELLPNFDTTHEKTAITTCGLALLTGNDYKTASEFFA